MKFDRFLAASAAAFALLLAACGGGGGGIGGTGGMHVSVTDAPACGYDEVNVTIERFRVHQSSTAGDNDSGWSEVVLNPARRVNLLDLTNGVLEELGETQLPAGTYTQARLVLAANSAANPLANSVVPTGGVETALQTPSGQQSGLKLNMNVDVPAGQVVDVVLDFDACKSVVKAGNSGRYNLKPVISVITVLSDAGMRIEGWVDPSMANSGTSVSAQFQGASVKATFPDGNGRFILYPVPLGTYDLVVTAPGRATSVMTGVPVVQSAPTVIGSSTVRIVPSTSTMRDVTGSVTPETATVRALQNLTGGPTVEVAAPPVDADAGAFALALPITATGKTGYVANAGAIAFTPDTAAAGLYRLAASSEGVTKTADIDTNAAVPPVTFTFP